MDTDLSGPAMRRVLIVDDEEGVIELLGEILASWGYDVATATTGVDALAAVPTFQPHVIVIDMAMPGLSGLNVLEALRRTGASVPMIFMTGKEGAQPAGAFAVIAKPFDFRQMADIVAAAVAEGDRTSG